MGAKHQSSPLQSDAEADARLILAADLAHQAVIPPAAADSIDGADALRLVLEGG
ncbi:hypothetical protein D3C76_1845220 [compost metagenome]